MTVPNVPNVPGVPTIPRDPNNPIPQPSLLQSDTVTATGYSNLPLWGLLDQDGNQVIQPDNWVSVEYRQDWAIADYQVEQGNFQSYDKVQEPFDIRLQISTGGSVQARADFLTSVQNIVNDLKLYRLVTPETTFEDCNIGHIDYRRTATNGVGILIINLYLVQIRVTDAEAFSSTNTSPASQTATKDPGAAAQVNDGAVQPLPATGPQSAALLSASDLKPLSSSIFSGL